MGTRSLGQPEAAKEPLPMTKEGEWHQRGGMLFIPRGSIAAERVNRHRKR
jgi:hypothetical protein